MGSVFTNRLTFSPQRVLRVAIEKTVDLAAFLTIKPIRKYQTPPMTSPTIIL